MTRTPGTPRGSTDADSDEQAKPSPIGRVLYVLMPFVNYLPGPNALGTAAAPHEGFRACGTLFRLQKYISCIPTIVRPRKQLVGYPPTETAVGGYRIKLRAITPCRFVSAGQMVLALENDAYSMLLDEMIER